ncbi:hypothetical protein U1Q18_043850 [Sarracenia purpurea var. burkii]
MKKLEGKVAIVTGGASGIGEATAHIFADHGARAVVIVDVQDDKGHRVAESIGSNKSTYVHCDVSDEEQVKSMVDWTVQTFGQLDVMFSNAGIISSPNQTILNLDFSIFDRLFAINVRGMAACVKHAARAMVERRVRGSIICTASVAASLGSDGVTDYTMSKHAVVGLVRAASRQLGEHGIRVNCVSPSAVATPLMCNMMGKVTEEVEKAFQTFLPLKGIFLKVEHVANAVLFLASEDSAFISGDNIVVDGGFLSGGAYN